MIVKHDESDYEVQGLRVAYRPEDYPAKEFGPIFVGLPGSIVFMTPKEAADAAYCLNCVAKIAKENGWREVNENADDMEAVTPIDHFKKKIKLDSYQIEYIFNMISAIKANMDSGDIFSAGFELGKLRETFVIATCEKIKEVEH